MLIKDIDLFELTMIVGKKNVENNIKWWTSSFRIKLNWLDAAIILQYFAFCFIFLSDKWRLHFRKNTISSVQCVFRQKFNYAVALTASLFQLTIALSTCIVAFIFMIEILLRDVIRHSISSWNLSWPMIKSLQSYYCIYQHQYVIIYNQKITPLYYYLS
jgi:hypothetical protein